MRHIRPILLPLISLLAGTLGAQQPDEVGSPAETKRSCTNAAAAIAARVSAQAVQQALMQVQTCALEGPQSLAALWGAPPIDSTTRMLLSDVSGHVRDRRVLEAVIAAAGDGKKDRSTRLFALATLVSLYDPSLTVSFVRMSRPNAPMRLRAQLMRLMHDNSVQGSDPLPDNARARILALFGSLATDADAMVREVASSLQGSLRNVGS